MLELSQTFGDGHDPDIHRAHDSAHQVDDSIAYLRLFLRRGASFSMVPKPQGAAVQSVTHRPLPPLPKLRVRRPNKPEVNPCLGAMTSVLGCWASSGYSIQGCAQLEQKLRQCMDAPRNPNQKKNNINYHLSRMYPKIVGPHKRD